MNRRGRRYFRKRLNSDHDNGNYNVGKRISHPPHLNGEEIGLFYAKINGRRNENTQNRFSRLPHLQGGESSSSCTGLNDETSDNTPESRFCHRGHLHDREIDLFRVGLNNEGNDRTPNRIRHPPHLKGKEIGLFYASLRGNKPTREERQKAFAEKEKRALGEVLLSDAKKAQIREFLQSTAESVMFSSDNDSSFKRKFASIVQGTIEEKINRRSDIKRDPIVDEALLNRHLSRLNTKQYQDMLIKRKQLPSYDKKFEILQLIYDNRVVLISGETGCGKTTQVAQYILDDHIENGNGSLCRIICTQPRRISAISVAERVAAERTENLGWSVGYQIRLESVLPHDKGSVVFCTTGVILRQMEIDPCLSNISHIILDEIHERDVVSDFLIALIKQIITKRTDLKLILMSATLNAEKFSKYFDNCPHLNIPGLTFPVEEYYLEDVIHRTNFEFNSSGAIRRRKSFKSNAQRLEYNNFMAPHLRQLRNEGYSSKVINQLSLPDAEDMNLDLVMALLVDICLKEENQGAILVFLPGLAQISNLHKTMETSGKFPPYKFLIIPLHSQMPTTNQKEVFERPPRGVRKIIIATNIAETSITIDDVVFVIDCGRIKISNFDVETNTQTLQVEWVSLANASQRKGRAGRVQKGVCFHLFTKARKMLLEQYQKPEILRTRLENTLLTLKVLQLGNIEAFLGRLMDSPEPEAVFLSINLLKRLNALDEGENLTPLGYHLARLPMNVQLGKMILLGAIFSCLDPILSIAACLDYKDAFYIPLGLEKKVDQKKRELSDGLKSDHLLLHQVFRRFEELNYFEAREFCRDYFISGRTLDQLQKMKSQFMENLYDMKFVSDCNPKSENCNINSENVSLVKAIICAGLYPNIATVRRNKRKAILYTMDEKRAEFHPKSILCNELDFDSKLLVYFIKLRSSSNFIHDGTCVHPLPVIFFGDNFEYVDDGKSSNISSGLEKLKFKCSQSTSVIIEELRNRLNWLLEYKISNPGIVNWNVDNSETTVLRAVTELITSEDLGDVDLDAFDNCD